MKLSKNPNYLKGLEKQLEIYKRCSSNVKKSYYIYINLDTPEKANKKIKTLHDKKNELNLNTEIIVIEGRILPSASTE